MDLHAGISLSSATRTNVDVFLLVCCDEDTIRLLCHPGLEREHRLLEQGCGETGFPHTPAGGHAAFLRVVRWPR